jgi:S1-C subfamily serine protease
MASLTDLEETVRAVVESVGPSVVGIGDRWGRGSGIVVADGRVVTNAHNVRGDAVTLTLSDERTAEATPLGVDVDGDVAVLSADTDGIPALSWSPNGVPGIGAPVFALANPGGRGLRVSFGIVSGTQRSFRGPGGRRIAGAIEHTAPLLPGSSGGPVVDSGGALVGVNTHRLGEGFYLAIAADAALKDRVDGLASGQSPSRRRLGVGIAPPRMARKLRQAVGLPDAEGLLVRFVEPESAAARGGIQEGDLIVAAAGKPVAGADDLHEAMDVLDPDATLELKVVRGTDERTVTVLP